MIIAQNNQKGVTIMQKSAINPVGIPIIPVGHPF